MPVFHVDNTLAKSELQDAISAYSGDKEAFKETCMQILVNRKVQLKRAIYTKKLLMLLMANNPGRASKLVDVIPDRELKLGVLCTIYVTLLLITLAYGYLWNLHLWNAFRGVPLGF